MLWDYICGYGVREGRKSCEGKHGTIGGNTFYGVSDLYSVVLLFFFFLRSLLIGYKFYLSGVQVNTVWLLSHRNVIMKNFNILNIFILA